MAALECQTWGAQNVHLSESRLYSSLHHQPVALDVTQSIRLKKGDSSNLEIVENMQVPFLPTHQAVLAQGNVTCSSYSKHKTLLAKNKMALVQQATCTQYYIHYLCGHQLDSEFVKCAFHDNKPDHRCGVWKRMEAKTSAHKCRKCLRPDTCLLS